MIRRILLCLAVLGAGAWHGPARAAVTATPVFIQAPKEYVGQILNATGTTGVTIVTAGANGTIVKSLMISNTDTLAYSLQISVTRSTVSYLLCTVNIPASAGNTTAAPPVSALAPANCPGLPVDSSGNPYLNLASGDILGINLTGAVTAGKIIAAAAVGGDF